MKIRLKFLVVAVFLASMLGRHAHAAAPNTYNLYIATTQAIASGPGTLFNIGISSGSPGDYVVCYDTYSINTNWATTQGTSAFPELLRVFVTSNTASSFGPALGYAPFGVPLTSFANGLTCAQSTAQRAFIWYRQPN